MSLVFHVEHGRDQEGIAVTTADPDAGPDPIPAPLAAAYPDAAADVTAYAELLATDGVTRGLIGPREVPRIWDRHIGNCAVLEQVIPMGATVADIGSGAGLPGLVLALVRPDLRVVLVEPLLRRVAFLAEAVATLALADRVLVVRARAEDVTSGWVVAGDSRRATTAGHTATELMFPFPADVVTSRAVAGLGPLIDWSWPLVRPGGKMAVLKGESAADEIQAAAPHLNRHRIATDSIAIRTIDCAGAQATVVVIPRPDRQG